MSVEQQNNTKDKRKHTDVQKFKRMFREYKCANCGKRVVIVNMTEYAYKFIGRDNHHYIFCGWNCKNKWLRNNPNKVPRQYILQ